MAKRRYIFWITLCAALVFRFYFSYNYVIPYASVCEKVHVKGAGIITTDPERKESGQIFVVNFSDLFADDVLCGKNLHVRIKTKLYPAYEYRDHIIVRGKLSRPYNFSGDDGREFDYRGYLAKDDVFYEIKSASVEPSEKSEESHDLFSVLFRLKHRFVSHLERSLGEPHSALAAGLVVGEKSALGSELTDNFRKVGLIHVVVLSGFNITIVGVALRRMFSFLPRVWGIMFGGVGIVLFGVLVGGGATVVRSCLMASIALIADFIRRDYNVYTALGFAAIVMLIDNPLTLMYDPSFQLSFLATLGLIILAKPFEQRMRFIPEKFGLRGTVATTLATQMFVSPFILYMMGDVSIIGVIVNILVLPFIPLTMLLVFLTGAAGFIYMPASMVIGWMAHIILSYELFMVDKFAHIPYASAHLPPFSFWWVVVFYFLLAAILFMPKFISRSRNSSLLRTSSN